ncbi:MAG: sialate O-acetylesterase [Muribaculaceae bacterium]|nr:sialate O-acetylesterase [Muribaculaceae bacterium]
MRKVGAVILFLCCLLSVGAQNAFYDQRASLFGILPVDSTDIVFLGNSLTNGCEWHELFGDSRIKNRGISGDIASGIGARLEPVLRGRPAKIFLMAGINDVSHHISADSIAHDVAAVVDSIISGSPGTKIYLQSCLPFNESFRRWKNLEGTQQVIIDLNRRLERLARDRGIVWIDLYPLFSDGNDNLRKDLTNDGLHLLGNGYIIWKEAIRKYVEE